VVGTRLADHDVVQHFNPNDAARLYDLPGGPDVGLGWARIPAGMVVRDHNRRGIADDGRAEEFPRCHQDGVEGVPIPAR